MIKKILSLALSTTVFIMALGVPCVNAHAQFMLLTPEYMGLLEQRILSSFIYPQEALTKGWEGVVKVRFALAQDGRVKDIDIAESSGYPLLDAAAILAIKDASPYPFPKNYDFKKNGDLEIILPVSYVNPQPAAQTESAAPAPAERKDYAWLLDSPAQPATPAAKKEIPPTASLSAAASENLQTAISLSDPQANVEKDAKELLYYVEMALKNNQPTKVAREEVEYARIKVIEAQRNFFPAFKIQAYSTEGDVYKVDYEEREAKVQLDQPLFYGGRLKYSLKQAKANLEISQKNYDRLKFDVIHKTETSYYNLVATRMNLKQQEVFLAEANDLVAKIEKLSSIGMVIPLEVNSARSWLEQMGFKIDGIRQDLYMADLTFKQVLNTKETPKIETELIQPQRLDLNYESCLAAAMEHRPEIYLSELLVKFNDYGQKVEAIRNTALTLDFTGNWAKYQGHYLTEPWKSSSNWYIGLKASLPWGASTINNSYASEESQPRFGQTSATGSRTISGEFNLFDNMKRLSDKKKADIDLYRAISDLDEAFKTVAFEVQDAFLNYQKAVLQLNTAEAEMKYRRNEAEIAKIRSMVGESSLSGAIEAIFSLSESHTRYIQALANYQISLANLRKATGYGIKF